LRDRIKALTPKKKDGNFEDLARKTGDITLYGTVIQTRGISTEYAS